MEKFKVHSQLFGKSLSGVVEVFGPDAYCLEMTYPYQNIYWEEYYFQYQEPHKEWRDEAKSRATWHLSTLYEQYNTVKENLQEYKNLYKEFKSYLEKIDERYQQIPDNISDHFKEFYVEALNHDIANGFDRVIRERYTAANEPWKVMTIDSICMYLNAISDAEEDK